MTTLLWVPTSGTAITLDGSSGVKALRGPVGFDSSTRQMRIDERVGGDGAILAQSRRTARTFTLPLMVDLSVITVEEVVRTMQSGRLTLVDSGRSLRDVEYVGGFEGEWSETGGFEALGWRKFQPQFVALDPWWLDAGWQHVLPIGTPTDFDAAIAFDAAIPFNGGTTTRVQILGDAPSAPVVEITGPVTELTVGTGDELWELATPLAAGEMMIVRHAPTGSFYTSSAGKIGPMRVGGQIDWSLLTQRSRLWSMDVGITTLLVQGTGTDANSKVRILYHQKFATPGTGTAPTPSPGGFTLYEDPPGSGLYAYTGTLDPPAL